MRRLYSRPAGWPYGVSTERPRINLLPWRDELRTQRRNQFFIGLGLAALAGILVIFLANLTMNSIIDHQQARNDLLRAEIKALDERIKQIIDLEEKKDRLVARMEIIEQLQRSRPEVVHIFDELVQIMPDGVYLTTVKQEGDRLEVRGVAESNTRVSALMRNADKSVWLTNPDLEVVEVKTGRGAEGSRASEFTVFFKQVSMREEEEAE
jgi:type IV pilus assembly protein PilN